MHVVYAAWLSLHYFRKNSDKKGKFVSTSSMCGLYPGEGIPLYTAAKHGVRFFDSTARAATSVDLHQRLSGSREPCLAASSPWENLSRSTASAPDSSILA